MSNLSRRGFLKATGAAAATFAAAPAPSASSPAANASAAPATQTQGATAHRTAYLFFNAQEAAFIEAAVARLIPTDETGPGAIEAGVANYIDKQLGGAWGAGERLYRSGPWPEGKPTQGYQLPFTPAELFRNALRAVHADLSKRGRSFSTMSAADQDAYLKSLEDGKVDLGSVPSKVFFESLLSMTIEGFFSDPVYGGNRDMVAWKLIGFPGAYATYYSFVDRHGLDYRREPMSLAENETGHIMVHPGIPAYVRGKGR